MTHIFKIVSADAWTKAVEAGHFAGAAIDIQDGYIHFSTAEQARETAAKHFAGQNGLMLVAFEAEALGNKLVWEPSRGGQLFPHLYDILPTHLALWAVDLPWTGNQHAFPAGFAA